MAVLIQLLAIKIVGKGFKFPNPFEYEFLLEIGVLNTAQSDPYLGQTKGPGNLTHYIQGF